MHVRKAFVTLDVGRGTPSLYVRFKRDILCSSDMEFICSMRHPDELLALLKFRYGGGREAVMPHYQMVSRYCNESGWDDVKKINRWRFVC